MNNIFFVKKESWTDIKHNSLQEKSFVLDRDLFFMGKEFV